jgi:dihydrofolate reductase
MTFACHSLARRVAFISIRKSTLIQAHGSFVTSRCYYHPTRKFANVGASAEAKRGAIFGIVAAITKDGVIGVDGGLPWDDPIPLDRGHFVDLTRDRILIVGRKTYADEDPTMSHIGHVRVCIVVSRTMKHSDLADRNDSPGDFPVVKLARSFDEALDMASDETSSGERTTEGRGENVGDRKSQTIECWVAGGEHIYSEALRHGNLDEVHLTHVDMSVDRTTNREFAHFPMACLKEHGFEEISRRDSGICSFRVYKRSKQKYT